MARDRYVSREEIADELGVEERTITNWVREAPEHAPGPFPSRVKGRARTFPRRKCLTWFIQFKINEGIARSAPPRPTDIAEAERRKAVADAEKAELQVAQLRAILAPRTIIDEVCQRQMQALRAVIVSMPGRYGPRMVGCVDIADAVERLQRAVPELLSALRDAEPDDQVEPAA